MAINIEIDDQQALAFRLLSMAGAWDIKKGSATIHFDNNGTPCSVEVRAFTVIPNSNDRQDLTVAI